MKIYFAILEVQFYHERGLQLNSHVNCRTQMDVWIFTPVSSSVHLSKIVTAPSLCPRLSPQWMAKHRYNTEQAALLFQPRESSAPCSENSTKALARLGGTGGATPSRRSAQTPALLLLLCVTTQPPYLTLDFLDFWMFKNWTSLQRLRYSKMLP